MLSLPIPQFEDTNKLHMALAKLATYAEKVAAEVQLTEGLYFITARQKIRAALREHGIDQRIDKLVARLLETK